MKIIKVEGFKVTIEAESVDDVTALLRLENKPSVPAQQSTRATGTTCDTCGKKLNTVRGLHNHEYKLHGIKGKYTERNHYSYTKKLRKALKKYTPIEAVPSGFPEVRHIKVTAA